MKVLLRSFAVGAIVIAACGDDDNAATPIAGVDGGGADGSSPFVDGGSTDAPTSNDDGSSGGHPIPLPTACTTPSITSLTLDSTAGGRAVAVTWSGTEAAIAYVSRPGSNPAGSVLLQRMDHTGKPLGDPVLLAKDKAPVANPLLGIASDGTSFVSCWEENVSGVSTSCASVAVGGTTAKPGYTEAGSAPFGLASDGAGIRLLTQSTTTPPPSGVQKLDTNAAGLGGISIGAQLTRVLAARPAAFGGGYVVADAQGGSDVFWQDLPPPGGAPNAGTLKVGAFVPGLAANDKTRAALVVGLSDKTLSLVVLAPGATAKPLEASYGNLAAIATGAAGFGTVWTQTSGGVHYQSVSATGEAVGTNLDLKLKTFGILAFTAVDDGFLVITNVAEGASDPKLVATHLVCL